MAIPRSSAPRWAVGPTMNVPASTLASTDNVFLHARKTLAPETQSATELTTVPFANVSQDSQGTLRSLVWPLVVAATRIAL